MTTAPGPLIWEIVKKNSCFLVKEFINETAKVQFSKEPNNLYNVRSYKYSGLANPKTVLVQPGGKDAVVIATTKTRKQNKPAALVHKSVMKKDFRKMARVIENQVQKLIAESPDLLLEGSAKYSSENAVDARVCKNAPKDDSHKENDKMEGTAENAVTKSPPIHQSNLAI